jgi:hypothetical protein
MADDSLSENGSSDDKNEVGKDLKFFPDFNG